jgi:hypothetical protein
MSLKLNHTVQWETKWETVGDSGRQWERVGDSGALVISTG